MTLPFLANQRSPLNEALERWIREQEQVLRQQYGLFENYYRGQQRAKLTDRMKRVVSPELEFRDNVCAVVVDIQAERLEVTGFTVEPDGSTAGDWIWNLWKANRMDQVQGQVHVQSAMKGDAYVMVSYDDARARPVFTFEDPHMIVPRYNPGTGELLWVSKTWVESVAIGEESRTRMNLFFPNRIEKFVADGSRWIPFLDPGEEFWPVPWLNRDGSPLGIPIVPFPNKALGDDFGQSELTDVVPMQDILNKSVVDLVQTMDTMAFQQRWTIGLNTPGTLTVAPGSVWHMTERGLPGGGSVGQFEAADPTGILAVIEMLLQHVAFHTRTPQHYFHREGAMPSGEALKTAEAGLVRKVESRQVALGNAWEDVARLAFRVQNAFGEAQPEPDEIETVWAPATTANEQGEIAMMQGKQSLGIPQEQLWRELGYTEAQIDDFLAKNQAQADQDANREADLMERRFRGGRPE